MMNRRRMMLAIPALLVLEIFACRLRAADEVVKTGTQEYSLTHNELERTFLLHVPPQYDGKTPLPLVMAFHGGMGTGKLTEKMYGWSEKADKEGFLVAYPNGTGTFQTWNAMNGCGPAFKKNIDDVGFVKALLKDIESRVKVDPKRVYATGMSNGAMLSHRLAAELPDLFAAIAPVAGSIGGKENADAKEKRIPEPASAVSVCIIHGLADQNVVYNGGQTNAGVEKGRIDLSVADAVDFWKKVNGCSGSPKKEELASGNVIKESYSGDKGDVVLFTIVKGKHAWPGSKRDGMNGAPTISATDEAWAFFKAHPKK
jgi:polyhydroxybutyrate depolymerase